MIGDGCDLGICGWGNNEHQFYSSSKMNSYIEGGRLILKAKKSEGSELIALKKLCKAHCASNSNCKQKCNTMSGISSARLRTLGKFSISPGYKGYDSVKVVVKVKVSAGDGIWPAVWMLPDSGNASCSGCGKFGYWAQSGEIDIFETTNSMKEALGTIHYGGAWPNNLSWESRAAIDPNKWNIMSFIWRREKMEWYLNQKKMHEALSGKGTSDGWFTNSREAGKNSPFDSPFHILVNVAVGGALTGNVDLQRSLQTLQEKPRTMHIDYIRVYGLKDR